MTDQTAQLIALTAYGNDYLVNGTMPHYFYPNNKDFKHLKYVDFQKQERLLCIIPIGEKTTITNPLLWFKYLKDDGCKFLKLQVSDTKACLEAVYNNYSVYWQQGWNDSYGSFMLSFNTTGARKPSTPHDNTPPEQIHSTFKVCLLKIAEFAFLHNLDTWGHHFKYASQVLEMANPESKYYNPDIVPFYNFSLIERQLLFTAATAWVFGGMLSWNDIHLDSKESGGEYKLLSDNLKSTIYNSIMAAINSSAMRKRKWTKT